MTDEPTAQYFNQKIQALVDMSMQDASEKAEVALRAGRRSDLLLALGSVHYENITLRTEPEGPTIKVGDAPGTKVLIASPESFRKDLLGLILKHCDLNALQGRDVQLLAESALLEEDR